MGTYSEVRKHFREGVRPPGLWALVLTALALVVVAWL
jgi:hypothetical protein